MADVLLLLFPFPEPFLLCHLMEVPMVRVPTPLACSPCSSFHFLWGRLLPVSLSPIPWHTDLCWIARQGPWLPWGLFFLGKHPRPTDGDFWAGWSSHLDWSWHLGNGVQWLNINWPYLLQGPMWQEPDELWTPAGSRNVYFVPLPLHLDRENPLKQLLGSTSHPFYVQKFLSWTCSLLKWKKIPQRALRLHLVPAPLGSRALFPWWRWRKGIPLPVRTQWPDVPSTLGRHSPWGFIILDLTAQDVSAKLFLIQIIWESVYAKYLPT